MQYDNKIVYFKKHCPTCKYKEVPEEENPCNECLSYPVNVHTDRPIKWEEKKE